MKRSRLSPLKPANLIGYVVLLVAVASFLGAWRYGRVAGWSDASKHYSPIVAGAESDADAAWDACIALTKKTTRLEAELASATAALEAVPEDAPVRSDEARTAPPAPKSSRGSIPRDVNQWRSLVSKYFPAANVDEALRVIRGESHGDPRATNPTSDCRGLFQLFPPDRGWSAAGYDPYDPETNIRLAAKKWRKYGWAAWSVKP